MNKKILIIEDNLEVREVLKEVLEFSGYKVATAEDGMIGVQNALTSPPDLIICDVMMPKLDGYGVLNILGKKPATADIPFIFLTAKAEKADLRRGMNLGADDYISKPFYKDELLQVIEARLKRNERLKKKFDHTTASLHAFIDEAKGIEEFKKLSKDRKIKTLKAKESLFMENEDPRYFYFVNSGQIKLYKTNYFGKEFILKMYQKGDFFGYTSLIKNELYPFAATATEPTEVSLIPAEDFLKLLYANRDVSIQFIKMLTDDVSEQEEQLLNLAYNSVRKRVGDAILALHAQNGGAAIHILRNDLAHIVGTTKESVVRALTKFKEDGWVGIHEGAITIFEVGELKGIV
ncbi:MAG: DNA-binding response OmpR family regulator [Saprospiraceae bacterium]|jgi:DNA-binding response OmpR family regulator